MSGRVSTDGSLRTLGVADASDRYARGDVTPSATVEAALARVEEEVIGPIARDVDDLALIFAVIAGPHPEDRSSWAFADGGRPVAEGALKRMRIDYAPRVGDNPVAPDVAEACRDVAGTPAISIPARVSQDGLPIGFQLAGRYGADWELIAMAREYAKVHPWRDRRPPI